jgi:hypothetical protein
MHIYEDEGTLAALVARMVVESQTINQPALIVTSEPITSRIIGELEQRGIDLDDLRRRNRLEMVDAESMLRQVLLGGLPDPNRFNARVQALLHKLCAGIDPCIPLIYADMAYRLVTAGNTTAAISMELLWNRLAEMQPFSLLCGYEAEKFNSRVPTFDELQAICEQHNTVQPRPH